MSEPLERIEEAQPRRFRPYPEYKDSGIEWLGEIPGNWEVGRLKTFASVQLSNVDKKSEEGQVPIRLCNYVDVYYNDRITSNLEFMNATATPDQVRRFSLREDDVLITKDSESWDDIAVPAVVAEDLPGVLCGYHLAHIRPGPRVEGRFLSRLFSATGPRDQFYVAANGITRFGLGGDAIRAGRFPVPPADEQRAIVSFLDGETAKIDGLVARKERLIELLQEKRTAVITRAVTRGLDPNVRTKGSGVEWLGEIPAQWKVQRLKLLLEEPLQYGANEPAELMDKDLPRYIRITDVTEDGRLREETFRSIPEDVAEPYLLDEGDVLFARSGATVGKTFRYDPSWGRAAYAGYLIRARLDSRRCDSRFLQYFTTSKCYWDWLSSNFIQATIQNVSAERYGNLKVAVPEIAKQEEIVSTLDRETKKIDELISLIQHAIERLTEFRTALISGAVTGKIDVREETA